MAGVRIARASIRSAHPTPFEDAGTDDVIDPRTCMLELDRMLPGSRCVVVDAGLTPAVGVAAFPHDHRPVAQRSMVVNGEHRRYWELLR